MENARRYPPEPLTPDEAASLLGACSRRYTTGIRNAALIAVLWRAGLRIGEALALATRDVDLDRGTLRVRHGKGDKSRTVGLDSEACIVLARWMDKRKELRLARSETIFCTFSKGMRGRPLSTSYVGQALKRLALRAGIERRVHPHGLRHTLASDLAREGVPMNEIQAQLGHASLATTNTYVQHIAPEELIHRMRSRPAWNARGTSSPPRATVRERLTPSQS